ncbi:MULTISPECIES: MFS transporter [Snodgrassella]|uniref:MFS transporter n=1 Tax=Snodgrassella TaxID=1193515 RepID=UPI000C1DFA1B|nr:MULTISPECIES: MFS transporter [Snodgrassella]MBI0067125.1 MFS transporter [Snodgrassella sp. M0110]MBI0075956.1 MFS transporter [Snodgrassella sp. M0118]MBI0078426.1 MFS transporter [Snodgrassella sp. M0112]PIT31780.1 hypothetical protein BHC50_08545 [Snodgrassella alvi]PIT36628.1 hypothetical protein BHC42_00460 [Snodgrassella alvi]
MSHKEIKNIPKQIQELFFTLYYTRYIGSGFLAGGLFLILRNKGIALDKLSLIPLMFLPLSFRVLWAPFIDKYLKTSSGHYRNWLLIAQFLMILGLFAIAFIDPVNNYLLVLLAILFFSFIILTQDLALANLASNIFEEHERGLIVSIEVNALMYGNIIGGAVELLLYSYTRWSVCMICLSALLALSFNWRQLWFFNEYKFSKNSRISETTDKNYWKNIVSVWKGKKSWCALLVIIPFVISPFYSLMPLALLDSGWSLANTAILLKLFGTMIMVMTIYVGIRQLRKLTRKQSFSFSIIFHACCLLSFIPISLGYNNALLVYLSFFPYFVSMQFVRTSLSTIIVDNAASSVAPTTAANAQIAIFGVFDAIVTSLSFYFAQKWGYFVIITGSVVIAFFAAFLATRVVQNQSD